MSFVSESSELLIEDDEEGGATSISICGKDFELVTDHETALVLLRDLAAALLDNDKKRDAIFLRIKEGTLYAKRIETHLR